VKQFLKHLIRTVVYWRLAWLPLGESAATRWSDRMKRWPAIFADRPFSVSRRIHDDLIMRLGVIDVIERDLLVGGEWDARIGEFLRANLRAGATFVDVGANIGYFTLLASRLVGERGTVLAVEPSQRNLSRLCEHLWINRTSNVMVSATAAGRRHGLAMISFPTYNNAGAATLRNVSTVQPQRALVSPLDDVFDAQALSPDLVKIDVEGYELEALAGMERMLRRCRPVVICELTASFLADLGQSPRDLLAFMESCGYRCETLTAAGSLGAGAALSSTQSSIPDTQLDVVFRHGH
jgi:FkbM family methyltransferase